MEELRMERGAGSGELRAKGFAIRDCRAHGGVESLCHENVNPLATETEAMLLNRGLKTAAHFVMRRHQPLRVLDHFANGLGIWQLQSACHFRPWAGLLFLTEH